MGKGKRGKVAPAPGELALSIATDNAAFSGGADGAELARILRRVAIRLEQGERGGFVRDGNGNTVGTWAYRPAE